RGDPDVVLLGESDELLVDFLVADAVHEAFDAGAHQTFRVFEVKYVGDRRKALLARFVGRRREHLRRQLLLAAVAVVEPDLRGVGPVRREVLHRLAGFRRAGDGVRYVVARRIERARSRIGEAAADGANERSVRNGLGAQLVGQFAHVGAGADGRR